jgi:glutamate dehydrogenase (NAD(P)+)
VTGKPIQSGGSRGRDKATGQGVVYAIEQWAADRHVSLSDATLMVQGFGNVGSWSARILQQHGSRLVAAEDATGAIASSTGIDAEGLTAHVIRTGGVAGFPGTEEVSHEEFLRTRADMFIPAALENQITAETAPLLEVKLVAEGANGPTDPEGDEILARRRIDLLPDIMCNSGGVIVSYFEWLQNKRSEYWDLEEIDIKLRKKVVSAWRRVRDTMREYDVDSRTASYMLAMWRLEKVYKERGIFP